MTITTLVLGLGLWSPAAWAAPCTSLGVEVPSDFRKLVQAGEQHVRSRAFDKAEPCFEAASAAAPDQVMAVANLGSLHHDWAAALFAAGNQAEAKQHIRTSQEYFERARKTMGKNTPPGVLVLIGRNHAILDDDAAARAVLVEVVPMGGQPGAKAVELLGTLAMESGPEPSPQQVETYKQEYLIGTQSVNRLLERRKSGAFSETDAEQMREGLAHLDLAIGSHPQSWPAMWLKGKALQALDDHEGAAEWFGKARALHPHHPDVAREYLLELLWLGRAAEALPISEQTVAMHPTALTLAANHALVQLLAGKVDDAEKTASAALAASPGDPITRDLVKMVQDVKSGTLKQPTRLPIDR